MTRQIYQKKKKKMLKAIYAGYTRQEKKAIDQFNLEGKLQQEYLPHCGFLFFSGLLI